MNNEYNAAEALEIGKAEEVILGAKLNIPDLDNTTDPPSEFLYVE